MYFILKNKQIILCCPCGLLVSSSYGTSSHIKGNSTLCSYAQWGDEEGVRSRSTSAEGFFIEWTGSLHHHRKFKYIRNWKLKNFTQAKWASRSRHFLKLGLLTSYNIQWKANWDYLWLYGRLFCKIHLHIKYTVILNNMKNYVIDCFDSNNFFIPMNNYSRPN